MRKRNAGLLIVVFKDEGSTMWACSVFDKLIYYLMNLNKSLVMTLRLLEISGLWLSVIARHEYSYRDREE